MDAFCLRVYHQIEDVESLGKIYLFSGLLCGCLCALKGGRGRRTAHPHQIGRDSCACLETLFW